MRKPLSLATCVVMAACSSHVPEAAQSEVVKPEAPALVAHKPTGVDCVTRALKAVRAAESQGAARYAKRELGTAYTLLNQTILMLNNSDDDKVCSAASLAESQAKRAVYMAISVAESKGAKRMQPRPVRLDTAPPSKPRIVKAAYHPKPKPKPAAQAGDPLLPGSKWEDVKAEDAGSAGVQDGGGASGRAEAGNTYVDSNLFYRGLARAKTGKVPGLSAGRDSLSEFIRYIVKRGDTLWWISKAVFDDPRLWPAIFRTNRRIIENPDLIYPGQMLRFRSKDSLSPAERQRLRDEAIAWDIKRRQRASGR